MDKTTEGAGRDAEPADPTGQAATPGEIAEFVGEIMLALEGRGPANAAVPERFGLIRMLQFADLARKTIERKSREVTTSSKAPPA